MIRIQQQENEVTIIKLAFFLWLAILAAMTWTTHGFVAGEVSKMLLCAVAFLGGIAGAWLIIYQVLRDE